MDYDAYFAEWLVKTRLGEARAFAQRMALLDALRPPRRPARAVLGLALIRIGRWILDRVPEYASEADTLARPQIVKP